MKLRNKIIMTAVSAVLLTALYMVIFGFSAQDAEQSGSLSLRISEGAVEFLNSLTGGNWSRQFKEELALYFQHPIRKLAHFGEYTCVGILVYLIWRPWMKRGRRLYLLTVVWVFVSGACDEFHQLFVPGRYGGPADVCLDTSGGIFGLLLCIGAEMLYRRFRGRKAKQKQSAEHDRAEAQPGSCTVYPASESSLAPSAREDS